MIQGTETNSPRANLIHVTITDTTSRSGRAVIAAHAQTIAIRNSIIANNSSGGSCSGSNSVVTNSLIEGANGCGGSPITSDPDLGSLTGSPGYYPLNNDSPAIGAGDLTYCAATDQRGEARPQPALTNCDIGAYEHTTLPIAPTVTDTPTASDTPTPTATDTPGPGIITVTENCSLEGALRSASLDSNRFDLGCESGNGHDTIILPAGGTTTLTQPVLLTSEVTIEGNGHTLNGNNTTNIFTFANAGAFVTLNNITLENGRVSSGNVRRGAAIDVRQGRLTVNNSTFRNNIIEGDNAYGGAIYTLLPTTIRNSTFSGNSAANGGAIAFFNDSGSATSTMQSELVHVTVSGNSATGKGAGIYIHDEYRVGLRNSIIANNGGESGVDLDCDSEHVTITASLIENNGTDCPAATYSGDPALDALTGSPAYFPLSDYSPAINVGDATYCTATDQRGESRPQPSGSNCDIGAYERTTARLTPTAGPSPTPSFTPTHTPTHTPTATDTPLPPVNIMVSADCPLPDAVTAANTNSNSHNMDCAAGGGHDTIILPASGTSTLSKQLKITSPITITGNGHTIDGNNATRILHVEVSNANLTLNNVTIRNGSHTGGGAGIAVSFGALTVNNSAFINNATTGELVGQATGAAITSTQPITVRNSTFSGNTAVGRGGAIHINYGASAKAASELIHVTISGNSSALEGDGIYIGLTTNVNLRNSIVVNNGGDSGVDLHCANLSGDFSPTISSSLIENIHDNANRCPDSTYSGDADLGALTGSPSYFPLGLASVALGAGDPTYCTASDQRGESRPQPAGTNCDIGAYERTTTPPTATPSPTALPAGGPIFVNEHCPIHDAVKSANDNSNAHNGRCVRGAGDDEISLPTGGGTTTLTSTLNINSNVTITGNGHTLSGGDRVRVIRARANLTLNNLTIRDGREEFGSGAGLDVIGSNPNTALIINNSAFISNRVGINGLGGGMRTVEVQQVTIRDSTFSGNRAGNAPAIYQDASAVDGTSLELIHVTVSNNTVTDVRPGTAAIASAGFPLFIRNSIIAGNTGGGCSGTNVTVTRSIIADGNDCGGSPLIGDPVLGALTGSPAYHPLGSGSRAIGAGDPGYCTATDQRGESRPQPADSICDIGAYEDTTQVRPTETPTPTQTPTPTETPLPAGGPINVNADCSIYDAVQSANDDSNAHNGRCVRGQGDDEIILPTGGGTTTLTSTLDISSNITITGNGHTLSGGNRVRVISTTANLTIDKLTIRDGRTTGINDGAGIELQGQSPSRPSLTITNSAFIHNIGENSGGTTGGAIFTNRAGQVRISNSTFSGNAAHTGGALGFQNTTRNATNSQVILLHVTISDTTVHSRTSTVIQVFDQQRVDIRNSIIANTVDDKSACKSSQGGIQIVSSIFEGGNDCGGNAIDIDPALGALTGSPAYYPLTSSSVALGGGNPNQCTATDQRGIMRPQPEGTRCDIGAYEDALLLMPTATSTPTPSQTPTPSPTPSPSQTPTLTPLPAGGPIDVNADCPIHDAVKSANDDSNAHNGRCVRGQGDDTINLPAGETSTLASTLNISSNITINGNAHIIDGNNAVRPFRVSANFALKNVTVQRGRAPSDGHGGAIEMNGRHTLIVENSSLRNNETRFRFGLGGAIYARESQAITIRNSTLAGNRAFHGGAIYLENDRDNRATLTHVTVVNNNSDVTGTGAVHAIGAQRMRFENSIFASNGGGNCEDSPVNSVELASTLITGGSRCPATTLTADPALGALTGSPAYYPLLDSSPAIGAGNSSHCTASDQIGNSRPDPAGSNCDIGAIESARSMPVQTPTPSLTPAETLTPSPTPTATNRPANVTLNGTACHIVDAVAAVNTSAATGACLAGIAGADTIALTENITLDATLTISSDLIINGAGFFLSGDNAVRVLSVAGDLTLNNITIKDGNVFGTAASGGGN